MSAVQSSKFNEGRLAQVLVAPIVSEKGTMVAEKHNQVLFKVLRDATKPEIKAAVDEMTQRERRRDGAGGGPPPCKCPCG